MAARDGGLTRGFKNRLYRANTTLIFLASCLAFAEAALVAIARLTDVDPALIAGFAFAALVVVVAALVIMYWRDPAFLTLSGEQAHDLRRLEILTQILPDQMRPIISDAIASGSLQPVSDSRVVQEPQVVQISEEDRRNLAGEE